MLQLPNTFKERMKQLLQDEYESFLQCYDKPAWNGLRINPLKITPVQFLQMQPFSLRAVPWCPSGFYYSSDERPGKHPYHAAGVYYLQEPSAMAVAEALEVQPGEMVLDLCAAPGGKSTQIAAALNGQGLLIANEIHPTRAKILSENIERMGIANAVVTSETPNRLAERFPGMFDRVLVDAPCSGEGMFRKLTEAIEDWSPDKVVHCHTMQGEILDAAADLLKPGGTLVYSTCTFAPLENEQNVEQFLARHAEFSLVGVANANYFAPGKPEWSDTPLAALEKTARLWPHRLEGEGHYIAKLVKHANGDGHLDSHKRYQATTRGKQKSKHNQTSPKEALLYWRTFAEETAPDLLEMVADPSHFTLFGEQLYYNPAAWLQLSGLKVLRSGLHLGTIKKNRLEPAHSLALAMISKQARRIANYDATDPEIIRFLHGESLPRDSTENGWTLVTVDDFPLGWGKQSGNLLKNHYPKGLRWL